MVNCPICGWTLEYVGDNLYKCTNHRCQEVVCKADIKIKNSNKKKKKKWWQI